MMNLVETLSRSPLFINIPPHHLNELIEELQPTTHIYNKGEYIARQGDRIQRLLILTEGMIRTEMINKEGNILEIDLIAPVMPLAPAFIYGQQNIFPVDVIASKKSTLLYIVKEKWLKVIMNNEQLLKNFLSLNANMTSFLAQKLQMISIKSLKAKLALYILNNTSTQNNQFVMKRTHSQLAEHFGVQRPSLSRSFRELINDQIISLDKRCITILNRSLLQKQIY